LFATGWVAGGTLAGVVVSLLSIPLEETLKSLSLEEGFTHAIGAGGFQIVGVACFASMAWALLRVARQRT
jgi:hypothetical protein